MSRQLVGDSDASTSATAIEIASLVVGIAGVLVSVAGFGLAFWQLRRTANASIASKTAMERAEKRMALNHLLVIVPQFHLIERDLDRASTESDSESAIANLGSCTRLSRELAGVISAMDSPLPEDLEQRLENLARLASEAKTSMVSGDRRKKVSTFTEDVRQELGLVVGDIAQLGAQYRNQVASEGS